MIGKLLYTSLVLTLFLGCGAEENSQNTQDIVENINNSSDTNQLCASSDCDYR